MSEYREVIAPIGSYAERPYYVPQVNTRVYCLEELCFVLYKNAFVLDTDIMDPGMIRWLSEECRLEELSRELESLRHQKGSAASWVGIILDYACFGTEKERHTITQLFRESADMDAVTKKKNHADYLLKNGKYAQAVSEYEQLLTEIPEADTVKYGAVLHNKAVGLCRMFDWDDAAACFLAACEKDGTKPMYELHYLAALRISMAQEDYIAFIAEHPLWYDRSLELERRWDQIHQQFDVSNQKQELDLLLKHQGSAGDSYYDDLAKYIAEKKTQYREMIAE